VYVTHVRSSVRQPTRQMPIHRYGCIRKHRLMGAVMFIALLKLFSRDFLFHGGTYSNDECGRL
jgi:hypothetical protein